ncbi:GIY-YIG nuclease family protein [Desulfovibrio caledoniensis]
MSSHQFPKTIKMFLMDSDPNGRMTCELSNWTGKAYRIPRGRVKDCVDRNELKSTAVYFLFGKADSPTGKPSVYIGEAENFLKRLTQHVDKDFWTEAVCFISKDENLNKAHIKHLESRLYELAQSANRYSLVNGQRPTCSSISEADQAEMEEFSEYIRLLISTMGYKLFEPLRSKFSEESSQQTLFRLRGARGAQAEGERRPDGFLVLAGATFTADTVSSFPNGWMKLRSEMIDTGVVKFEDGKLVLQEDYLFSSPSAAAALVMGRSANGLQEWKLYSGETLKEIESDETKG